MKHWKHYKYKNLTLFLLSILYAFLLFQNKFFHDALLSFSEFEYLAAFIAGIFYVSTFSMPTGIIMLFIVAEKLNPVIVALIAGIGTLTGDLIIFHAVKNHISRELIPLYYYFGGRHLDILLRTKYFRWTLPLFTTIILISPLPDELTVGIIGLSKMKTSKFLLISYIFNTLGIFFILSAKVVFTK